MLKVITTLNAGNAEEVKKLLERDGATAKAHTRPGNTTALHCAAFRGHYEVCRILLTNGADPNAMDDFDRTALHRAARKGHKQVLRLLIDRGADVLMYDSNGLLASDLAAKKKFDPSITKVRFGLFFFFFGVKRILTAQNQILSGIMSKSPFLQTAQQHHRILSLTSNIESFSAEIFR